jgi:hypothetical protein
MIMRKNMHCFIMAGKHVKNIQAIARQPPITEVEGMLDAAFSVGSALRLYSDDPRPAEGSSVE